MAKINVVSPVGRIVSGNLYKGSTTDADGKPLVVKNGPNAGQPRVNFYFGVAVPKQGEAHWAHTPWGRQIWDAGNQAFPQAAQSPAFAWKIEDGDSQIPNTKGKKPCDNEGYPGHWIIKVSGGFAPKIYRQENGGFVQIMEPDAVKPGHYVEVSFTVEGNGSTTKPGVYLNHDKVCFRAFGPEIFFGVDVASVGFGQSALPAGASMTPLASAAPMPGAMPGAPAGMPPGYPQGAPVAAPVPGYAPVPGAMPQPATGFAPPAAPGYPGAVANGIPQMPGYPGAAPAPLAPAGFAPPPSVPAATASAPIPVTPNPQFLQVPPPPGQVAPAAPAGPRMTAAATATYEAYRASGWTDAMLVQNGLMLA